MPFTQQNSKMTLEHFFCRALFSDNQYTKERISHLFLLQTSSNNLVQEYVTIGL